MADDERPEPGSFYQLLFSDPIVTLNTTSSKGAADVGSGASPDYSESFYGPNPPKMLCFGSYQKEEEAICSEIAAATAAALRRMVSQSDSSSASSGNNHNNSSSSGKTTAPTPNPNRKKTGSGRNPAVVGAPEGKRPSSQKPAAHAAKPRPRKEKLGERIATLQQLVSPFGKTDTASVLHEAMAYIKFLHDQVQVLSSPYLHSSANQGGGELGAFDLRSRGLCLVPVSCTAQVDSSTTGADYWAPAAAGINASSFANLASSAKR